MTKKFNIEDTDEIIKVEAERFLLLFEKAFKSGKSWLWRQCCNSVVTKVAKKNQLTHSVRCSR